jgi:glycosyltransferase involved in cell wall biosynthesis
VIQPRRGAFVEIVERTNGGLLVNPDDPDALAEAFERICQSPELTAALSGNAFRNVLELYSIHLAASRLLDVFEAVLRPGLHD